MRHQRKKRVPRSSAVQTTKQKATRRRRAAVRKKLMTELRGPKLAKNAPMIGQGSNLNIGLRGAGAAVGDVAGVDVLKKSHRKSKKKASGEEKTECRRSGRSRKPGRTNHDESGSSQNCRYKTTNRTATVEPLTTVSKPTCSGRMTPMTTLKQQCDDDNDDDDDDDTDDYGDDDDDDDDDDNDLKKK